MCKLHKVRAKFLSNYDGEDEESQSDAVQT